MENNFIYPMWTVTWQDILYKCRTPGGDRFTEFVDALIKAEAYSKGIHLANIATNQRTNIPDGGVDTEVQVAVPNDPTGWLDVATCWQYKAIEGSKAPKAKFQKELRQEIGKRYSRELIEKGYGYRFCICDEITPAQRSDWEKVLTEEVQAINVSAPLPKVISASDLATWASYLPSIIIRFFKPDLEHLLHLQSWGRNITALTSRFVDIKNWSQVKQSIIEHVDFSRSCDEVILSVQGEAGVGKTRLVYETLTVCKGAENFVLYTLDTKAINIASSLANNELTKAILVADECLLQTRLRLQELLIGHRDRIRVVCLDNSGERPALGSAEFWLERISKDDVAKVLEQNFPSIPKDRRRAYVSLSQGFIRFAADLCKQDSSIAIHGNVTPALTSVSDYLKTRLNSPEYPQALTVVQAISLFRKIGYRDSVNEELSLLCKTLELDKGELMRTATGLKDSPGFIAFAGRYLYITPEIIAKVAFDGAWNRWAYDPSNFLANIPDVLLEPFLQRVKDSGSKEVRQTVGYFFRVWFASLQPLDLTLMSKVTRLVILVDTNPDYYLPQLAQLVDRASIDELLRVYGGTVRGPRRDLVWLAERMARFPEFFPYAESILWKLALAESEEYIANNATHVWQDLFRIFLSGTSISFSERISFLQTRLETVNEHQIDLALGALNESFATHGSRVVGSPLVAGRIPPDQWKPETEVEIKQSVDLALNALIQVARSPSPRLREGALNIAIQHLRTFLLKGYFEHIKTLFPLEDIPHNILLRFLDRVEDILAATPDAPLEIQEWLKNFIPDDLHGALIRTVRRSPWNISSQDQREVWYQEISSLAEELCQNQEALKAEMEWLCSAQALGVWELGRAMGEYDANATCLDLIMQAVIDNQSAGLARGYVGSLITNYPYSVSKVNDWLDRVEPQIPTLAHELYMAGGTSTQALTRTLRLIDSEKLSLAYLDGFIPSIADRTISSEEFQEILLRLIESLQEEPNNLAIQVAIKLVYFRLTKESISEKALCPEIPEIWNSVWTILEAAINHNWGDSYQWGKVLRTMLEVDKTRVAQIASFALVGKGHQQEEDAAEVLVELSEHHPELVLQYLGDVILSEETGWNFYVEKYRYLINSLPLNAMKTWLHSAGVVAAQRIAGNLALPYLDENGNPVIPPLTEFVLSEFEDDDFTFQKFCSSSHSLQVYGGNISSQKRKEAQVAQKFLNHPLQRIREWAKYEASDAEREAIFWDHFEEEQRI